MENNIDLTSGQRDALARMPIVQGEEFVLMTKDAFRELLGLGDDLADSLVAIHQGFEDISAKRTRPFRDVLADLDRD
jgi:hypothetical protein